MGLLEPAVLDQFMGDDTLLAGHPVRQKLPDLIEINSGSLGHGLPIDELAVVALIREHQQVLTMEEHALSGGLSTIISEMLLKHQ